MNNGANTSSSWITTFESENLSISSSGSSVSIGSNGEIYVGGFTYGIENEFGQWPPGREAEVFISSLDEYGNINWTQVVGTTGGDYILPDINVDQNGNVNIAYSNGEDLTFQIIRFSEDGDILQSQNNFSFWNGYSNGLVEGVSFDDDGIAYVTGGIPETDSRGDYQIGIVKSTDTEQDIAGWAVSSGSSGTVDIGKRSLVSENNSVYVIGITESDLDGEINPGYRDNFISKYSTEGDLIWTQMMVEPTSYAYMICDGQNDDIYVAGFTNQDDLFIIRYDENGNQIWKNYYPLTSRQETTRIATHPSDGIYVADNNKVYRVYNNGELDLYLTLPEDERISSLSIGEDGTLVLVGKVIYTDVFVRSFNANDYIVLDNLSFDENLESGTAVALLSGTDEYGGLDHTYTLVDGDGASDNQNFSIIGNEIIINSSPDFEDKSSYEIRIQVEDQNGLLFEQSITLTVNDLEEMPIEDVSVQEEITTFTLEVPVVLEGQEVDTIIIGTENRDRITGTSDGEVLAGMEGKDILIGGNGADGFLFNQTGGFGNRNVDKIKDFNPQEGDSILLDNDVFSLGEVISIEVVSGRWEVWRAQRNDVDFVYDLNTGLLYFNENGRGRGWGDGGSFVQLQGSPELGADDFTIV